MKSSILRIFQIPELRTKILTTVMLLVVCRIGGFIPVPGINGEVAVTFFKSLSGGTRNLFQLVDMFSGGAFSQMTVVALGVMPYISASIIMQMVVQLIPGLQRESRENPDQAKRKVNRMTRLVTLLLSFLQASVYAKYAISMNIDSPGIIAPEMMQTTLFGMPWLFYMVTVCSMTTGTLLLMWIGEQITEHGIGNGISLIITLGIISQLPSAIGMIIQQLNLDSQEPGQMTFSSIAVLVTVFVAVSWATIQIIQGHRRIPLQYARRVVGRKEVQGTSSYIPLKVNYAGVIPVIFASAFLMFTGVIGKFVSVGSWGGSISNLLTPGSWLYLSLLVAFILFFTYFWTSTQFRPDQIASDMKKNGAFIPGIRQGKPTQDYLESTMNRITLIGACSLALLAVLPTVISRFLGVSQTISYFFGGTSLLILIGVILDTLKQIESHMLMKRYEGFMKKGRVRGR